MIGQNNYAEQYANGFNQGMQAAAGRFELYIFMLLGLFALRIVIKLPFVRSRLEDLPGPNAYDILDNFSDVLAFFILALMLHGALGMNVVSTG